MLVCCCFLFFSLLFSQIVLSFLTDTGRLFTTETMYEHKPANRLQCRFAITRNYLLPLDIQLKVFALPS